MEGAMENGTVKAAEKLDVRTAPSELPDQPTTSKAPVYDLNEVAVGEQPESGDEAADISSSPERNLENSQDIIKALTKKNATYRRKGKQQQKARIVFKEPAASPEGATRPKSKRNKHDKLDSAISALKPKERKWKSMSRTASSTKDENFSALSPISDDVLPLSSSTPEADIETEDISRNGETPAPFARTPRIWEAINSLEIFQRMPQRPHFSPLLSSKEIAREGLAVGAMVTFSCLVEKIPKFTLDQPASLLEDYLETLSDLETHGFIVEPIRKSVNSLLSIKTRYDEAEALSRELSKEKEAVSEMDQEIANMDEQIQRLEDERAAAEAKRAAVDDEIRGLQVQLNEVGESVDAARVEFERVAW